MKYRKKIPWLLLDIFDARYVGQNWLEECKIIDEEFMIYIYFSWQLYDIIIVLKMDH